jgi:hypothetical protein
MNEMFGPRRIDSELTLAIDRSVLPPISTTALESVGLDPEHPESKDITSSDGDRITLMPCPTCAGCGMVTPERWSELVEPEE